MKIKTLEDLLTDELKDLYSAENQITKALPKMAKTTQSRELRSAFEERWGGEGTYTALRVNLPPKQGVNVVPPEGTHAWYGGKGDEMDNGLRRTVDLSAAAGPITLSFQTWFDIEEDWDYGFVQVSTDGGATWTSLVADGMTATPDPQAYPAILAQLEDGGAGFTGASGGWVGKAIDLFRKGQVSLRPLEGSKLR